MRFHCLANFALALLFTSCANEGVIVQKDSVPLPFYESLGVDGSHKLALRDHSGAVHSQLVTPEVYEGYAQGEYFNDSQPASAHNGAPAAKETLAVAAPTGTQPVAAGNSARASGSRVAANGSGHSQPTVKSHPTSSAPTIAATSTSQATPKAESPVVSGQFAAPVQESASIHPLTSLDKFSTSSAAAAKLQAPEQRVSATKPGQPSAHASVSSSTSVAANTATVAAHPANRSIPRVSTPAAGSTSHSAAMAFTAPSQKTPAASTPTGHNQPAKKKTVPSAAPSHAKNDAAGVKANAGQ